MNKHIITLLLVCSTHASAAMPAEGDSTTAANQSMRVVTFKAVPGTARTYYYHRDHLGSTTLITNKSGEVVQRVEYLPTGETFIEQQDTSWSSPHKFNGRSALRDAFFLRCSTKASKLERRAKRGKKELDEETGLYYYGARYYDPRLSMWLGTDPMQGKYPDVSTYVFCMGNPVIRIDRTGKDNYIITDDGRVVFFEQTDDNFHKIYAGFANGKIDYSSNYAIVSKNFIEDHTSAEYYGRQLSSIDDEINKYNVDTYYTTNETEATSFFEFAANNTSVEWSNVRIIKDKGYNYVSTSHSYNSELRQRELLDSYDYSKGILVYANHSHAPSSIGNSKGDIQFAKDAYMKYPNMKIQIYSNGTYRELTRFDKAGVIGEIVCKPQK